MTKRKAPGGRVKVGGWWELRHDSGECGLMRYGSRSGAEDWQGPHETPVHVTRYRGKGYSESEVAARVAEAVAKAARDTQLEEVDRIVELTRMLPNTEATHAFIRTITCFLPTPSLAKRPATPPDEGSE